MSWESFTGVPIERMGSLVTSYAQEKLPPGVSPVVRNARYTLNSVATRFGLKATFETQVASAITGTAVLVRSGETSPYFPVFFDYGGRMFVESPVGSSTPVPITPTQFSLPAQAYMRAVGAFQRLYCVFGDLIIGKGTCNAVYNGANLDPMTQRPVGEAWKAATVYERNCLVTPTAVAGNGHTYQCTTPGTSAAAEPVWPTTDGGTIADGTCVWTELTTAGGNVVSAPAAATIARVAGVGTFAAARDVYVMLTLVNPVGESAVSVAAVLVNTVLNDRVQVTSPSIPRWLAGLAVAYAITGYNVYQADVATGAAAPAAASYKKVNGAAVAIGVATSINTTAVGVAPPTANTARITAAGGNICAGTRYGVVFFVNRNDNISGARQVAAVFTIVIDVDGYYAYFGNIPVGPDNVTQRIIAIGPAALSNFGPFFYIPENDVEAGIAMSSTVIDDNTTTAATISFTDDFLQGSNQLTDNLRKIKLPPQADIQHLPSTRRLACVGESGQPSLLRLSEPDDPETYYGDTGYMYIARDDGERLVTSREIGSGVILGFKEKSTYKVTPSDDDPIRWKADFLFAHGASGPKAVAVGDEFVAFAERAGAFIWNFTDPEPSRVTTEIHDLWQQINWTYAHRIVVAIDEELREVRWSVPFGSSTVPNLTFTMSYVRGLQPPIFYSHFAGKEIANPEGRKWSIDDYGANDIVRVERPLTSPNAQSPLPQTLLTSQILISSPGADGTVNMIMPGSYADNGEGYESTYEFASVGKGDQVVQFGGVSLAAQGVGKLLLWLTRYQGMELPLKAFDLTLDADRNYRRQGRGHGRQFGIRVSNGKQAGVWWELFKATIYVKPVRASETAPASKN